MVAVLTGMNEAYCPLYGWGLGMVQGEQTIWRLSCTGWAAPVLAGGLYSTNLSS